MLRIVVPISEGFDESKSKFVTSEGAVLDLEHSLVSLSKWESRWEKPFLVSENKTEDQTLDYIRMMILGDIPPEQIFSCLTPENIKEIDTYINAKMTATVINQYEPVKPSRETVTAEIIYYWMFSLGIPLECENWHLNRLLTLIRVFNAKNAPKQKAKGENAAAQRRAINEARRQQMGTRG